MTRTPNVLSVGRLYCDLIFTDLPRMPSLGTEIFAGGFNVHAGGGAFITAAHLAARGVASTLGAYIPAPPFRDVVSGEIERSGVCMSFCAGSPEASEPQVTVALADRTDRAFVTRRTGAAFPEVTEAMLREAGITHIHVGELGTLVERPEVIALARRAGCTLSLDCGWDEELDLEGARDLISAVDLFLPNELEAARLDQVGLSRPYAPLVVVKRGARGAEAFRGEASVAASAEPVDAVEATGAGDAFNAGFLSKWLIGCDLSACLAAGNQQGARAVSTVGGFGFGGVKGEVRPLH